MNSRLLALALLVILAAPLRADVGDAQIRTDHPWYPGELACSTFERLFATQAELYRRVVGVEPKSDEQKALAAWLWRNTHYYHAEDASYDLWGQGFTKGQDQRNREYWTGLFANGFGLCGTTHSQWVAEMQALLGHNRGRGAGVDGHNAFEVFLTGGPYGAGKWVLLDHDLSTVIFNKDGTALLSIPDIQGDLKNLIRRDFMPQKQHGWLVCGLHPDDGGAYAKFGVAEYLAGYSGVPPMVHLRRGETLRRYPAPGLDDGKTFVFWGRNYNAAGIPGPERSLTWVNQPDLMYQSKTGTPYRQGQARFGNAVYTYQPNFADGSYREGVIAEDDKQVTFEFYTPYVIAATPAGKQPWAIYEAGGKNGLVLRGQAKGNVALSIDQGKSWIDCGAFKDGLDLTDHVKGRQQYFLRVAAAAKELDKSGLKVVTVCQANSSVLPRLKDGGSKVTFQASGKAVVSAGPTREQARAHVVDGDFGKPTVTLELTTPRKEQAVALYAAAHVNSGNPPRPDVAYQVEYSVDGGKSWKPVVKDWSVTRRGHEPGDFWSQGLCWGSVELPEQPTGPVRVRFRNNGGKMYARCEAHLIYRTPSKDGTKVTFAWNDDKGPQQMTHVFAAGDKPATWDLATGQKTQTRWVEFEPAGK